MTVKKRGRPRKDPERLATWKPPEGWGRLVVWMSPQERKALKQVALDADVTVADLVRSLAGGLHHEVITADELLTQVRKGARVMEKIPTIFERGDDFKVVDSPREGCEWVFSGEGAATEKLDGTNIRITTRIGEIVRVEKRRNPSKLQKKKGIVDGWYVDADEYANSDRWIYDAAHHTDTQDWKDGEHACEAIGPSIQGNPLGLDSHICVPFNLSVPDFGAVPRSYAGLKSLLAQLESRYAPGHLAEGIVFHHPDGRRAKIKTKDFASTA